LGVHYYELPFTQIHYSCSSWNGTVDKWFVDANFVSKSTSRTYVLGLSSGASLGVAFVLLGAGATILSTLLLSPYGVVLASTMGSSIVLIAVLVSQKLRDTMAILIVGLMFGSFTSAIVGILTYFSTAEELRNLHFGLWET
jgi:ABC-type Fe3+-siderophore transport system permease subunit